VCCLFPPLGAALMRLGIPVITCAWLGGALLSARILQLAFVSTLEVKHAVASDICHDC